MDFILAAVILLILGSASGYLWKRRGSGCMSCNCGDSCEKRGCCGGTPPEEE